MQWNRSGVGCCRDTHDASLLKKARQDIHRAFPDEHDFDPESLFIVTWDDVGAYENQFQPVHGSDFD